MREALHIEGSEDSRSGIRGRGPYSKLSFVRKDGDRLQLSPSGTAFNAPVANRSVRFLLISFNVLANPRTHAQEEHSLGEDCDFRRI